MQNKQKPCGINASYVGMSEHYIIRSKLDLGQLQKDSLPRNTPQSIESIHSTITVYCIFRLKIYNLFKY